MKVRGDKGAWSGCQTRAAGVGLGKVSGIASRDGNGPDAHRRGALVAHRDPFGQRLVPTG